MHGVTLATTGRDGNYVPTLVVVLCEVVTTCDQLSGGSVPGRIAALTGKFDHFAGVGNMVIHYLTILLAVDLGHRVPSDE